MGQTNNAVGAAIFAALPFTSMLSSSAPQIASDSALQGRPMVPGGSNALQELQALSFGTDDEEDL